MRKHRHKVPLWIVLVVALLVPLFSGLTVFYFADLKRQHSMDLFWSHLLLGDPVTLRYTLTAAAQCLAATLGILVAVVLFTVQLTANRYTPKVIDVFVTRKGNILMLALFCFSILFSLWVAHTIHDAFVPQVGAVAAMALTTACYCLLIPYTLYLFDELEPDHIIDQIQKEAQIAIQKVHRNHSFDQKAKHIVSERIEQIAHIVLVSVQTVDSETALHGIQALTRTLSGYLRDKVAFHKSWYHVDERHIPGSPQSVVTEIVRREAWVEFRAFRKFRLIFAMGTGKMGEVPSAVAQSFRSLGIVATEQNDRAVLELLIKYMNSILRTAIVLANGQAINDTLYQYRLLSERLLETHPDVTKEMVNYLNYYAMILLETGIRRTFETVAYDLRKLNERAFKKKFPYREELLENYLALQHKVDYHQHTKSARELWKSYLILASFYLVMDDTESARMIYRAMEGIPLEVLLELKTEIMAITDPQFWEITDRIINYYFAPQEQKEKLEIFFDWFLSDLAKKSASKEG
ncbi:MAG: DUF2254 domain-containing protein [Armatimonadetes bacterium]|nr:DUF2254 domain-containing protein [Armatimonadota bacterium]